MVVDKFSCCTPTKVFLSVFAFFPAARYISCLSSGAGASRLLFLPPQLFSPPPPGLGGKGLSVINVEKVAPGPRCPVQLSYYTLFLLSTPYPFFRFF